MHIVNQYLTELNAGSTCIWVMPGMEDFLAALHGVLQVYHESGPGLPINPYNEGPAIYKDQMERYKDHVLAVICSWSVEGDSYTIESQQSGEVQWPATLFGWASASQIVALFNNVLNLTAA